MHCGKPTVPEALKHFKMEFYNYQRKVTMEAIEGYTDVDSDATVKNI